MCIMTLSRQAGVDIHNQVHTFLFGKLSIFIKVTFFWISTLNPLPIVFFDKKEVSEGCYLHVKA